ncbi:MAG: hypothetical protein V1826_02195 [bacterium]
MEHFRFGADKEPEEVGSYEKLPGGKRKEQPQPSEQPEPVQSSGRRTSAIKYISIKEFAKRANVPAGFIIRAIELDVNGYGALPTRKSPSTWQLPLYMLTQLQLEYALSQQPHTPISRDEAIKFMDGGARHWAREIIRQDENDKYSQMSYWAWEESGTGSGRRYRRKAMANHQVIGALLEARRQLPAADNINLFTRGQLRRILVEDGVCEEPMQIADLLEMATDRPMVLNPEDGQAELGVRQADLHLIEEDVRQKALDLARHRIDRVFAGEPGLPGLDQGPAEYQPGSDPAFSDYDPEDEKYD